MRPTAPTFFQRSYTSDFEVYRSNFDPLKNPEVEVYIAIDNVDR